MDDSKEPVEFKDVVEDAPKDKENNNIRLKDFLTGNIFTRDSISSQFPFLVFLLFLAVLYISNHYRFDRLMRNEQKLRIEVKNLRAESVTTTAELMKISRQTEVLKIVQQQGLGLEESTTPPKKVN